MADPAGCADGYIRLDDDRYEVRDVQNAIGLLVDEGHRQPRRRSASPGESYGGGVSLELATLNDRDDERRRVGEPVDQPGRHAAASSPRRRPVIPWSDLAYSLMPNGRTLDYQGHLAHRRPLAGRGLEAVVRLRPLRAGTLLSGYYSPPGTNSQADLTTWNALAQRRRALDGNAEDEAIAAQIAQYHSAYYLLDGAYGT